MRISAHIGKFRQFHSASELLDPLDDFELWLWAITSAGTALINAALHAARITDENQYFASQIPDVYALQDGPGQWSYAIGTKCDLIHVGTPPLTESLPDSIRIACDAMRELDAYRNPCIRGTRAASGQLVAQCQAGYKRVVDAATAFLNGTVS
jgi:hypothetical protein